MTAPLHFLCLICVVALAWQPGAEAAPLDRSLAVRTDALREQVELRYASDSPAAASIERGLSLVMSAWRDIDRPSEGDFRRFHRWLDAAFRTTLPGRSVTLPDTPRFVGTPALEQPEGVVKPAAEAPVADVFEGAALLADQPLDTGIRSDRLPAPRLAEPGSAGFEAARLNAEPIPGPPITGPELAAVEVAKPVVEVDRLGQPTTTAEPFAETPANSGVEAWPTPAPAPKPTRSRWSRHPAAAPLDWANPFGDDPSASANPLRSGSGLDTAPQVVRRPTFANVSVAVDMSELTARVRGYNNAVRSLQQRVLGDPAPDAFLLADWADELERLAEEESFLDLYRGGLPPQAMRRLPPSPSISVLGELLKRRANDQLQGADDRGAIEQRALETISARLSRLQETRSDF
ncbi:MAG: hypothetical protein AAFV43_07100 [Planctomycetota bacterium]